MSASPAAMTPRGPAPLAFTASSPVPASAARLAPATCGCARPGAPAMSLSGDVSKRLTAAMKARKAEEVRALRLIRAAFLTKQKEDGGDAELGDEAAVAVLRKLAKMRRESIEMFEKGGRDDLVGQEVFDLSIVEEYLPKLADEPTTRKWAAEAIEASGARGSSQSGKAIGMLMKHHRGVSAGGAARAPLVSCAGFALHTNMGLTTLCVCEQDVDGKLAKDIILELLNAA
jgi:uncharacterized protein